MRVSWGFSLVSIENGPDSITDFQESLSSSSMKSMFISQYSFVTCIVNMISSIWPFIPVKILTCILQRMLICGSRRNQWSHLISSMLGISLVIYCFRYSAIYLILLSINTWNALQIARKHRFQSQGLKIIQLFYISFSTFEISRQNSQYQLMIQIRPMLA